jgi:hypothetical protein
VTRLLAFLPSWVPFAVVGVLLLGLIGGFFALKASYEAEGAAKVQLADRDAIIKQNAADAAESAKQISIRDKTIGELQKSAGTVREVIQNAPNTSGCGPAVGNALDWLRGRQLGGGAKAP